MFTLYFSVAILNLSACGLIDAPDVTSPGCLGANASSLESFLKKKQGLLFSKLAISSEEERTWRKYPAWMEAEVQTLGGTMLLLLHWRRKWEAWVPSFFQSLLAVK